MPFVFLFIACFGIALGLLARPMATLLAIALYAGAFLAVSALFGITLPSPVALIAYGVVGWPVTLLALASGLGAGLLMRRREEEISEETASR